LGTITVELGSKFVFKFFSEIELFELLKINNSENIIKKTEKGFLTILIMF